MCLPQCRLPHQPELEKSCRNDRHPDTADHVRCPSLMGIRRQSKRHSPKRNQRRHGTRLRSHHPNLPRLPRHLRRRQSQLPHPQIPLKKKSLKILILGLICLAILQISKQEILINIAKL